MPEFTCPSCGKSPGPSAGGQSLPQRCESCGRILLPQGPAPAAPPAAFGKYTLDREVGRGSMGIVYDARDTTLDRRVALKIMHSHRSGDPKEAVSEWQRFLQEARLTANLEKH